MDNGGNDSEGLLVKLTRMEGKLDLSNLRHEQTETWKATVDQRLHRHGNEISNLQAREHQREGEKKGISNTLKVAWMVGGSGATAVLMALARKAGVL